MTQVSREFMAAVERIIDRVEIDGDVTLRMKTAWLSNWTHPQVRGEDNGRRPNPLLRHLRVLRPLARHSQGGRLPMGQVLGGTWRRHIYAAVRQSMGAPALRRERSPRVFGSRAGVISGTARRARDPCR